MPLGQCLIIYLKKVFMGKKKQLMFWQFFPFHIKDVSKFFLNKLLTIILKAPVSMTQLKKLAKSLVIQRSVI